MGEQISGANGQHDPMKALRTTIEDLKGQLLGKDEEIARLRLQIEKLQKMLFGPASEKRTLPTQDLLGKPGALPFPELQQLQKELDEGNRSADRIFET